MNEESQKTKDAIDESAKVEEPGSIESALDETDDSPPQTDDGDESLQEDEAAQESFVFGDGLSLEVSSEKMSAILEVSVEQGDNYTGDDLLRYLSDNNISSGVLENEVRRIHDETLFNQKIKVAKGRQAQHGKDGYVDWDIDLSILEGAELIEKGGRVDHKERTRVIQVTEGQRIARLVDPTEGEAGENIHGESLPPNPGKEAKFPNGKNTSISEDGKELFATIDGVICKEGEKYAVSPIYTVEGDVNYASGNVRFDETVQVSGGVLADFKIEAGQDIHVNGLIEGAFLTAGGAIHCAAGVQGGEKAILRAEGDITAKFVNHATLIAGGDVIIEGPVTQSHLKAGGKILLSSDKGVALGGTFEAETEINVQSIGSDLGVKTKLFVGNQIGDLNARRQEEEKKIQSLVENYKRIQGAQAQLNKLRDAGKITEEQNALRMKITRAGLQIQGQVKKLKEGVEILEKEVQKAKHDTVGVIAREQAWPGTMITILGLGHTVKNLTSKAHFALKGKDIEAFGYNPEDEAKKKAKKDKSKGKDGATPEAEAKAK